MTASPENRWTAVNAGLRAALAAAGRDRRSLTLVAVSKTQPAEAVRELAARGQRDFGENYLQEARAKQAALADLDLVWHFIGPLQANKTREIAAYFDWVHGLDREKIAQRLSAQRPADRPPLNVLIQVNVSGEASKSGCHPDALPALHAAIRALPGLRLRGLMCLPEPGHAPREPFARLRTLQEALADPALDCLSMGMSDDYAEAIAEGATHVRIGSALFGPRPTSSPPLPP